MLILVIGEPGSGKTTSLRNLDDALILTPNNKELPFPGWRKKYIPGKNLVNVNSFREVAGYIEAAPKAGFKTVVIEDITHLFNKRVMNDILKVGYQKWSELAKDIYDHLIVKGDVLRHDVDIVIIGHTVDTETKTKLYTPGKLLENNIKVDSYFTYIFHAVVQMTGNVPEYLFLTNTDGVRMAKSPMGMFPQFIPNDLKLVLDRIRSYELGEVEEAEEKEFELEVKSK